MTRFRRWLVWGFAFFTAATVTLTALGLPMRGSYGWLIRGERVMSVRAGSPADRAGLAAGDRLAPPAPPPPIVGTTTAVRVERGDQTFDVTLTAAPAAEDESARALLATLLAAAFILVAGSVWALRADRLVFAFALFSFSCACVIAPRPVSPEWLIAPTGPWALLFGVLGTGATLLLPAALVDFFARFPEGRPGTLSRRLVSIGYGGAYALFFVATLGAGFSALSGGSSPAQAFLTGGAFAALAALYFAGGVVAAVLAFVDSVRRAPAHHRPRLVVLAWAVAFGLLPLAVLTLLKNTAPDLEFPGERWAGLSLLLVPLGFAYATIVHRVFDVGGAANATSNGAFGFRPGTFQSFSAVLDEAAATLTAHLGLEHCAVFAVNGSGADLASMHGRAPLREGGQAFLERMPATLVAAVAGSRSPVAPDELEVLADGDGASRNGDGHGSGLDAFAEAGTSLLLPLFSEERCRAILALGPRLSGPWFDPVERRRLGEFAAQASIAVENALLHDRLIERATLERDVVLARRIQDRLLPAPPPLLPTVDVAGATVPAGDIGGDTYDLIPLGDRSLGLAVADVCGKGLPAALLLAAAQAHLRGRAAENAAPGALLARLNDELTALHQPEKFVCLAYARLDARRRTLTWANAGLNPPILVHADGRAEELPGGGLILGVTEGQVYAEVETRCARGSLVAFYTDGLTDSRDEDECYGTERLATSLARNRHLRAARLVERVLEESTAWHRTGPADDRTIVIIKFL